MSVTALPPLSIRTAGTFRILWLRDNNDYRSCKLTV